MSVNCTQAAADYTKEKIKQRGMFVACQLDVRMNIYEHMWIDVFAYIFKNKNKRISNKLTKLISFWRRREQDGRQGAKVPYTYNFALKAM